MIYRSDIDGLRAVAVFAVFIFHAFPGYMKGGFVGVDIFFVISGFLISSIIFSHLAEGTFSFIEFYSRRIRRIYPVLITVLAACLVYGWFFLLNDDYELLGKHVAGGAGFISNIILWFESGYFDNAAQTKPLLHLWSLGIEEQFYIIWPLFLWLAWKKRLNLFTITVVIAILSFSLNLYLYKSHSVADFFSPLTRFWELLCGAMLAWANLHHKEKLSSLKQKLNNWITKIFSFHKDQQYQIVNHMMSILGAILLIVALFITKEHHFPGKWALLPVLATVLLIAAGNEGYFNQKILSNKVLVWFGLISYPMYLWHWPLITLPHITQGEIPLWMRFATFPVCILFAWLTTRFIENPLRFGNHYKTKVIGLFIMMLFIGIIGFVIYKKEGIPSRLPTEFLQLTEIAKNKSDNHAYYNGCYSEQEKSDFKNCPHQPNHPIKPTIAIWGDSHAAHLVPGLEKYYSDQFNIWERTVPGCPALLEWGKPWCQANNHYILNEIIQNKPQQVILSGRWINYDYKKLENTIHRLRENGIFDIVIVGPVPIWKNKLPKELIFAYATTNAFPVRLKADEKLFINPDKKLAELCKKWQVRYISPMKLLCNEKGCLTKANNSITSVLTNDQAHLTESGSNYLISAF